MTSERFILELEPEKCELAASALRANANKFPALGPTSGTRLILAGALRCPNAGSAESDSLPVHDNDGRNQSASPARLAPCAASCVWLGFGGVDHRVQDNFGSSGSVLLP